MNDIRQSPQFANFMRDLGWQAEKIGPNYIYLRKFPLIGYFAKMPRPKLPLSFTQIHDFKKSKRIFRLKVAPFISSDNQNYESYHQELLENGFKIEKSPFNPTTTIQIDLTQKEEIIFKNFKETKRRGVRRAIKHNVFVKESSDIEAFINIRKKQYFPIGPLIGHEMKALWKNFYPKNASLLLAYPNSRKQNTLNNHLNNKTKAVAGILLLFYDDIAYYWLASSLKIGKKLFAPTLLVWKALQISKKKGCKIFDFEGIYDGRFPKAAESWKGFTKFKEGFGGKEVTYMENFKK